MRSRVADLPGGRQRHRRLARRGRTDHGDPGDGLVASCRRNRHVACNVARSPNHAGPQPRRAPASPERARIGAGRVRSGRHLGSHPPSSRRRRSAPGRSPWACRSSAAADPAPEAPPSCGDFPHHPEGSQSAATGIRSLWVGSASSSTKRPSRWCGAARVTSTVA